MTEQNKRATNNDVEAEAIKQVREWYDGINGRRENEGGRCRQREKGDEKRGK